MMSESPRMDPDLFPLPLGAFEHYMVLDDRPSFPMTFFIELTVSGNLDRRALEAAVRASVVRHPMLASTLVRKSRRWHWQVTDRVPAIGWAEGPPPIPPRSEHFLDLTREPGLRVWVGRAYPRSRLTFQFHHAATDGLGAMQFLGDVLAIYGRQTATPEQELPELEPVDPTLLRRRSDMWTPDSRPSDLLQRLGYHLRRLVTRHSTDLARPLNVSAAGPAPSGLPYITRLLDRKTGNMLRTGSLAHGVTVNETYLLALFRTLRQWNAAAGRQAQREHFQIVIPATYRKPLHDACPAANLLSYVYLNRRGSELDAPDVLRTIHAESHELLHTSDSRLFTSALEWLHAIPGATRMVTQLPVRFCTAVLSNVGDVRRQFRARMPLSEGRCVAGSIALEALTGVPPIRQRTTVAVSMGTYAGTHFVNFNCDPARIPPGSAEQFADLFIAKLLELGRELDVRTKPNVAAA